MYYHRPQDPQDLESICIHSAKLNFKVNLSLTIEDYSLCFLLFHYFIMKNRLSFVDHIDLAIFLDTFSGAQGSSEIQLKSTHLRLKLEM